MARMTRLLPHCVDGIISKKLLPLLYMILPRELSVQCYSNGDGNVGVEKDWDRYHHELHYAIQKCPVWVNCFTKSWAWTYKTTPWVCMVETMASCLFWKGFMTFSAYRGRDCSHSGTVVPMRLVLVESFDSCWTIGSTRKSTSEP